MKNRPPISIFVGVLLCVLAIINVYHYAQIRQPGNALLSAFSGIAGGLLIGTITTLRRTQPHDQTKQSTMAIKKKL